MKNYKKLANDISSWLENYMIKGKLDCFVIGVSGGVDSAVVSTLCARTGIKTYVRNIEFDNYKINTNAKIQINHLNQYTNVNGKLISIEDTLTNLMYAPDDFNKLALANTQSRLRMVYLYALANTHNGLVVGTGNLIEDNGIGYFTKFGDGGVDISPIGGLLKSEVYGLAEFLEIPVEIRQAKPTDGLWEGSPSDEERIGATYPELEWAMEFLEKNKNTVTINPDVLSGENEVEWLYGIDNIACGQLTEKQHRVLSIYIKHHIKNKHKMKMPPIFEVDHSKYN